MKEKKKFDIENLTWDIVHESDDENGNPYQDWNQVMDSTSGIKGVNGEGADE